jgi:protease II
MTTPENATEKENWTDLIPHRKDVLLEGIEIFKNYLVVEERSNGLNKIQIKKLLLINNYLIIPKNYNQSKSKNAKSTSA